MDASTLRFIMELADLLGKAPCIPVKWILKMFMNHSKIILFKCICIKIAKNLHLSSVPSLLVKNGSFYRLDFFSVFPLVHLSPL